jgi:hypothetical protein
MRRVIAGIGLFGEIVNDRREDTPEPPLTLNMQSIPALTFLLAFGAKAPKPKFCKTSPAP